MKISNNRLIQFLPQSNSVRSLSQSQENMKNITAINSSKNTVNISDEGYQKQQQAVFNTFFDTLSEPIQKTINSLEEEMLPLLEKEENGGITRKDQDALDALFQKFDKIIINNSDENTQRILLD